MTRDKIEAIKEQIANETARGDYWAIRAILDTLRIDLENSGLFVVSEISRIVFYVEAFMDDTIAKEYGPIANRLLQRFDEYQ